MDGLWLMIGCSMILTAFLEVGRYVSSLTYLGGRPISEGEVGSEAFSTHILESMIPNHEIPFLSLDGKASYFAPDRRIIIKECEQFQIIVPGTIPRTVSQR